MVFCAKRFQQTFSTRWAVATSVCAQIMVYYKETAFLLVWGFAAGSLIWHCWNREKRGWDLNRLRDKESRLNLCLFSIGFLFLLYYLAVMLPHFNVRYANDHRIPGAEVVGDYFKLDLLAWLFLALFIRRSYMILRGRVEPSPLWEGLAFGGAAYFVSYLYLGMYSGYYLAPVDLIAVLYVGRWAFMSWERRGLVTKVAITVSVVAILIQDVSLSAFRVFERKNVIHGKAEIARVVKLQFQRSAGNPQRIFFPFSSPYSVMEFAAYLSYRGVPVEGAPDDTTGMSHVVLVRRAPAKIGPCVDYKRIVCHAATSPGAGDLVIVMPDDGASAADIAPYRDGGEPLLSYEPYPPIPQWMSPLLNYLHVVSYAFPNKKLPDRWLHASVVMWNQSGNR